MKLIADDLKDEISIHIESVRKHLIQAGADAILIAGNANIYYTAGRFFRGYVYIPVSGHAIWFVIKPEFPEAEYTFHIRKPEDIPHLLSKLGISYPTSLALEFDTLSYSDIERLKKVFPQATAVNGSPMLRKARAVKTTWELQRMREDGIHQAEVYRRVTHAYKEDMTDVQFQVEIEKILRLEGCLGFIRTSGNLMDINLGSVIAGDNADNPSPYDFTMGGAGMHPSLPGGANGTVLRHGQTVMVDMNGSFNGYQTDMTRVWKLGEIPAKARKAHECSIKILRTCEKTGKPGIPIANLYAKAIEIVEKEQLQDFFMGHRQKAPFIGHGIGIELNEQPVVTAKSKDILEENMTIALEPKFVIPGVGAVGVENTYVVTKYGLEPLTIFPEEIQEL